MSELILHTSDDGRTRLDLRVEGDTVWLSQLEIAELFQTTKHNVSIHTKNIFEDGELTKEATVKESLTVQTEGQRKVKRYHNFDDKRRPQEALDADAEDLKAIEDLEKDLKRKGGKG